ncbi:3-hydroxyacyl-CoA dehydrogenase NAD-binding domain-containing protein [Haliangium ochraceum]
MELRKLGVIGAGTIGIGVAQALADSGIPVVLVDTAQPILDQAADEIRTNVRMQAFFRRDEGELASPDEILARIELTTDVQRLDDVDFVVENITENWPLKRALYERIDAICPERTVFAANTSAIPITQIGGATRRPDRILGMHFMNPVPLKSSVEVIRGFHTSDKTIAIADQLLEQMGKKSILVNDSPGFVSNRVLMLTVNEAIFLLHEGVSDAASVDRIFKECFGHKMGPLETADLIGLDTILYSLEVLYENFNDSKFRPCPLLRKMVHAGRLGRKTGQGFHTHR